MPLTDTDLDRLDRDDPLAPFRSRFALPERMVYLDGNSLGPPPAGVAARLGEVIEDEWGRSLIRGWSEHGWLELPLALGEKIARLVGAAPGQVVVADSTSVDLFKLLAVALALRPERSVVLVAEESFPTDAYIAEGLLALLGRGRLRRAPAAELEAALDDSVAVLLLGHVDYRSGALRDLAGLTAAAHAHGALALWDLAHSAGALPVELDAARADLAVGCGYKFLNGGPGAPAFLYVAHRHQQAARPALCGWLGHADPFAFEPRYRPAQGIARHLCGTPPILSMSALDAALDLLLEADLGELRRKSMALGEVLIRLVEERCAGLGLRLASPRDGARRGSQVCFAHADAERAIRRLIARGVIGDFRPPDVLRFGIAPLYLRFRDLGAAADALRIVLR